MSGRVCDFEWAILLVEQYLSSVRVLVWRLCAAYGLESLSDGRRNGLIPRVGSVGGLDFEFHGIGCRITDGVLHVDFDFLPNGGIVGFDAWRLHLFSAENPSSGEARSVDDLKGALDDLARRGTVCRVPGSRLYVICDEGGL